MAESSCDWAGRAAGLKPVIRDYIDGRWREQASSEKLDKRGPRDGRLLYHLGMGVAGTADTAVQAARASFRDARWSGLLPGVRKDVLLRFAALIETHREELALLECLDVGKPIQSALDVDIPMAVQILRFNAEAADKLPGRGLVADRTSLSYRLERPIGVVAGIVGWNFPLVLAASKIGPALAMGNSLVLKPSELTSLSAARLAELASEAGVPDGVFNVIHGGARVGDALARHGNVDMLTFTGSTRTGKQLMVAAGQSNMKRLTLECGGKAANIVFADAPDLNAVAEAIVARAFWNQGQVCTASSRLLVQSSIKERLVAILVEKTAALQVGDPLDPATGLGALVSADHQEKVEGYIAGGASDGARLVYRNSCTDPVAGGFFIRPAIFDGVSSMSKMGQEEIFGPVLAVMTFGDENEVIKLANSTIYGLSATVWTTDLGRAHRLSMALDVGWTVINAATQPAGGPGAGAMAISPHKQSGLGVEGGLDGLEDYLVKTAVQVFV